MQEWTLSSFPMQGSSWKSNLWELGSSITSGCSFHLERGCIDGFRRSGCCWFPSWCLWQSKRRSILRDLASQSSMMCSVIRWADGLVCWQHGRGWAEKWAWKVEHKEVYMSDSLRYPWKRDLYSIYLGCESHSLWMLTALPLETLHTSTWWAADNTVWCCGWDARKCWIMQLNKGGSIQNIDETEI